MADKVTELELRNIIGQEINNSMGYMGGNLSAQRKKSLEYYMGEPLGTEIDGRSQVVSVQMLQIQLKPSCQTYLKFSQHQIKYCKV